MILIESKVFLSVLYFLYQKNLNETGVLSYKSVSHFSKKTFEILSSYIF